MHIPVNVCPTAMKKFLFESLSESIVNGDIVVRLQDDRGNIIPARVTVKPDGTILFDQIQGDAISSVLACSRSVEKQIQEMPEYWRRHDSIGNISDFDMTNLGGSR